MVDSTQLAAELAKCGNALIALAAAITSQKPEAAEPAAQPKPATQPASKPAVQEQPQAPAEILDLPVVKIAKPKAAKKKVTVKWKKVSKKNQKKIKGIEIQVATDKKFTQIVKKAKGSKKKTSKVIKGLKSKKKYYIRIRAYGAPNHYSVWKSKSVKVK